MSPPHPTAVLMLTLHYLTFRTTRSFTTTIQSIKKPYHYRTTTCIKRSLNSGGGAVSSTNLPHDATTTTITTPSNATPDDIPPWAYDPRPFFKFEIIHESTKSRARVGRIHTPHGVIDTPAYVAVATNGALKGVDFRDSDEAGQQLVFANTYHLLLQPGPDVIGDAGGLHKFTNRNAPFITDSGGFQVSTSIVSRRGINNDNFTSKNSQKVTPHVRILPPPPKTGVFTSLRQRPRRIIFQRRTKTPIFQTTIIIVLVPRQSHRRRRHLP
mmetsp:Transcript_53699/g.64765  ORF Transcript_53699/g.64765 Transcript_53699/m.64765 type:complete len:269 (-) Transcript_53699:775-1581(-)